MVPTSSADCLYHLEVAIQAENTTGTGFLQNYIESILGLQDASCRLTQGLLPSNAYVMSCIETGVKILSWHFFYRFFLNFHAPFNINH